MPIEYKPDPYGIHTGPETLVEQEHKDSCNINIMLKKALNGQPVRMSSNNPTYGYDDTTLSGLDHRIQMQETIESLEQLAPQAELTEEQLNAIPEKDRKRFGFKAKAKTPTPTPTPIPKNDDDEPNDDDEKPKKSPKP